MGYGVPTKAELDAHLTRDQESGIYHVKFLDAQGKSHTRSTKQSTIEKAREVVVQSKVLEMEMAARARALTAEALTAIMAGRKVSLDQAIAEWVVWRKTNAAPNTVRTQELVLRHLVKANDASKWPVTRLTFEHLDGFVNSKKDTTTASNRDVRLASIRSFFDFVTAKAYYAGNPSKLVRVRLNDLSHEQKEPVRRVPFSEREFKHIMAHTTGKWKWWTALSYWAGLRLSDCACLEWGSIMPDEIVVWTRKSGARVALPIDDPLLGGGELRGIFFDMMAECLDPKYVFPDERAIALDPARRARHSVYYARILADLGIEGKSFHCLRHSFATRMEKAGKTIEQIGRLLGHSRTSEAVTEGYVHR
jgi:integrase